MGISLPWATPWAKAKIATVINVAFSDKQRGAKNKKPKVDLNDLEIQMITDGLKKAAGGKSHKK